MSQPPPDWDAADEAYRRHHFSCPTCCAAGVSTSASRCPEGLALWKAYESAGTPPHFLWIKPHAPSKRQQRQRIPGQ